MKGRKEISKTEYFIGNPTSSQWSSVYFYSPQVPATFDEKGEIFAVIALSGPVSFDSPKAGDLLLDQLHEQYFESQEEDVLLSLEKAVLSVKKRLLELLQYDEKSSTEGIDLSLLAVVVRDRTSYVVRMGEAKIFGYRDKEVQEIGAVLKDPDGRAEIKVGSFVMKEGDTFMLTTPNGRLEVSDEDISDSLKDFQLSKILGLHFDNEALSSYLLFDPFNTTEKTKQAPIINATEDHQYEEDVLEYEGNHISDDQQVNKLDIAKEGLGKIGTKIKDFDYAGNAKTFQVLLHKTFGKAWKWIKKHTTFFANDVLKVNQSSGVYLKGRGRMKTINWRLVSFMAVVLFVGGYFLIGSVQKNKEQAALELKATTELDRITTMVDGLSNQVSMLVSTRESESEKKAVLSQLTQSKSSLAGISFYEEETSVLENNIDNLVRKLSRKIIVKDVNIIKDFGVIEGTKLSDIDLSEDAIFVSDQGNGIIYKFDFVGGEMVRLAEGLDGVKAISYSNIGELLFVDTNSERAMGRIKIESGEMNRFPGMTVGRLGNLGELDAYEVGEGDHRAYGVRSEAKEIVQMRRAGDSYGLPTLRLSENNLNTLLDMDINEGRIYVVSAGEGIRRFYGQDEFENNIKGVVDTGTWENTSAITVDDRYIYAVDNQSQSINVFTKYRMDDATTIDFVASYDLSGLDGYGEVLDIVTNRQTGSLYALTNSKIIELKLSDLREFSY